MTDTTALRAIAERASVTSGAWDALDAADAAERQLLQTIPEWLPALLDHIDAQARALEEARAALEPFAKAADVKLCADEGYWSDEKTIQGTDVAFYITFGDLKAARTASQSLGSAGRGGGMILILWASLMPWMVMGDIGRAVLVTTPIALASSRRKTHD